MPPPTPDRISRTHSAQPSPAVVFAELRSAVAAAHTAKGEPHVPWRRAGSFGACEEMEPRMHMDEPSACTVRGSTRRIFGAHQRASARAGVSAFVSKEPHAKRSDQLCVGARKANATTARPDYHNQIVRPIIRGSRWCHDIGVGIARATRSGNADARRSEGMNADGAMVRSAARACGPVSVRPLFAFISSDLRHLRFPFLAAGSQRTGSAKPRKFVAGCGGS
jgi:hypothetical protein